MAPSASAAELPPHLSCLIYRSNGVYSLAEAASAGDVAVLQARLAEGADPNQVDERGDSVLHLAARGHSLRALELLLAAGADPTARDAQGRLPAQLCQQADGQRVLQQGERARERELRLCRLITRADEARVRAALAEGVNPNARSADRSGSLLHYAVSLGHASVVRALLEAGADVNATTVSHRQTPLHIAAGHGDLPVLNLLLAAGADPMRTSGNGSYPLHDAIWRRHLDAVRLLLPAYAAVNFCPRGGPHGSPLSMAIFYGRSEILRAFLDAGFNPNDPRLVDEPPLILAVSRGHADCVKLLLEAGADRKARDSRGKTAADYATAAMAPLLR